MSRSRTAESQQIAERSAPVVSGAFERCSSCSGSGLCLNYYGEPDECPDCDGGLVRARGKNGRFTSAREVQP